MTIVVTAVARDFFSDEIGLFEAFVLTSEFHFCHHQAVVVTMKFIYLPCVSSIRTGHEVTMLIDDTWLTKLQKVMGIAYGDFGLELIARQSCKASRPLDGQVGTIIAYANANGAPRLRTDIALLNMTNAY